MGAAGLVMAAAWVLAAAPGMADVDKGLLRWMK
jgi:hypothetical protein